MTVWDSMALNAQHTEREIGDESNINKPDIAMRCAECDCANGGDECNWFGSPMAIITALRAEIDRCHERLEIKRMHRMDLATGETTPVDVPLQERASLPDGIDCRDETIRLLRDNIETLRNNNAQLLAQLRELAQDGEPVHGSTTEPENAACQPAGVSGPLLPCPFCGGEAVYTSRGSGSFAAEAMEMDEMHWVYCSSQECLADFGMCETAEEAIAGWNRRPASQSHAILSAIAAEKATWPHAGVMHAAARDACDNIATRIKQLMGDA